MLLQCWNLRVVKTREPRNPLIVLKSTRNFLIRLAGYAEHWELLRDFAVVPANMAGVEVLLIMGSIFLINPDTNTSSALPRGPNVSDGNLLSNSLGKLRLDGRPRAIVAVLDASMLGLCLELPDLNLPVSEKLLFGRATLFQLLALRT
jgi:hypothetical protein